MHSMNPHSEVSSNLDAYVLEDSNCIKCGSVLVDQDRQTQKVQLIGLNSFEEKEIVINKHCSVCC